jgi:hypothetical protein
LPGELASECWVGLREASRKIKALEASLAPTPSERPSARATVGFQGPEEENTAAALRSEQEFQQRMTTLFQKQTCFFQIYA